LYCAVGIEHILKWCVVGGRPCVRCARLNRPDMCRDRIQGEQQIRTRRRSVRDMMAAATITATTSTMAVAAMDNTVAFPITPIAAIPLVVTPIVNYSIPSPSPSLSPAVIATIVSTPSPMYHSHHRHHHIQPSTPTGSIPTVVAVVSPASSSSSSAGHVSPPLVARVIDNTRVDAVDAVDIPTNNYHHPTRSASRSPARKRDRRMPPSSGGGGGGGGGTTQTYSTNLSVVTASSTTNGSSSYHHTGQHNWSTVDSSSTITKNNDTTQLTICPWSPSIPFVLPRRLALKYSESNVIKCALLKVCASFLVYAAVVMNTKFIFSCRNNTDRAMASRSSCNSL
jgi:hypothetical protein